jgi:pyruvate/2-oxoglutarate dehydrogenase complex dihydrolipoamide acyltransferase (E2) component
MDQFVMPSLGADMDEGTVVEWLVNPGDPVHRGDPIAVVDTDKAAIEVECFVDGTVGELLVPVGQRVAVGTPLATIDGAAALAAAPGARPEPSAAKGRKPRAAKAPSAGSRAPSHRGKGPAHKPKPAPRPAKTAHRGAKARAEGRREPPVAATPVAVPALPGSAPQTVAARKATSPYARKLARQRGLDIAEITGSGRNGMVTSRDVLAFVPAPAGEPVAAPSPVAAPVERPIVREAWPSAPRPALAAGSAAGPEPDRMRAAIARLMARSKREIPHYYLATTVDLGTALDWLRDHNRGVSVADRVVPSALLLRATALAAARHPELNGYWIDNRFQPAEAVNLGVAVSLRRGGMVAPAILGAEHLGVVELMARLRDLVARARTGRLRGSEMEDPTITVTNLGDQGVESVQGVIYPPQVALVGFGRVVDRPWARAGMLGVRPCVTVTLAADHRATDGFTGSRFLDTIDHLLQTPEEL